MVDPFDLNGTDAKRLKQQVQSGDFSGMRQYLARTRRAQDWQDRCFLLSWLSPLFPIDTLTATSAAEPEAADLLLLLGVSCFHLEWQGRGSRIAELTSTEQFSEADRQLQSMMDYLGRVYSLDPGDPTPHVFAMRGLVVFTDYEDFLRQEYAEAIRLAPDCVPAHFAMVRARSRKWGGSNEEALHLARAAVKTGNLSSDLPACLFMAHFFAWEYLRKFDKNKAEADRYLRDPSITQELNQTLDRWIGGNFQTRRSSIPYLHQAALWYYLSGDYVRLKRVFLLTGNVPCDHVWKQIGDPTKTYPAAQQKTRPAPPNTASIPKKTGLLGWFNK